MILVKDGVASQVLTIYAAYNILVSKTWQSISISGTIFL